MVWIGRNRGRQSPLKDRDFFDLVCLTNERFLIGLLQDGDHLLPHRHFALESTQLQAHGGQEIVLFAQICQTDSLCVQISTHRFAALPQFAGQITCELIDLHLHASHIRMVRHQLHQQCVALQSLVVQVATQRHERLADTSDGSPLQGPLRQAATRLHFGEHDIDSGQILHESLLLTLGASDALEVDAGLALQRDQFASFPIEPHRLFRLLQHRTGIGTLHLHKLSMPNGLLILQLVVVVAIDPREGVGHVSGPFGHRMFGRHGDDVREALLGSRNDPLKILKNQGRIRSGRVSCQQTQLGRRPAQDRLACDNRLLRLDLIAGVIGDRLEIETGQIVVKIDLDLGRRLIERLGFPDRCQ